MSPLLGEESPDIAGPVLPLSQVKPSWMRALGAWHGLEFQYLARWPRHCGTRPEDPLGTLLRAEYCGTVRRKEGFLWSAAVTRGALMAADFI